MWDYWPGSRASWSGPASGVGGGPSPDRAVVHSHDFNRYLTPFRAEWDHKDPTERTVVVGR